MRERFCAVLLHGLLLCIVVMLGSGCTRRSEAAITTFDETVDLVPASPQAWQPMNWDVTSHSRNSANIWHEIDTLSADFGPNCTPPPDTHIITTYEDSVFVCDGTLQTTLGSEGYHMTYLTPDHLVDFSDEEAVIQFDVSTLRFRGRDFLNVWVTPYEDNLQLPIQGWLPAATGEPKNGVLVRTGMTKDHTRIESSVFRDFAASTLYDNYTTIESVLAQNGLSPSNTRLETVEMRLSADHLSVCFTEYDHCFLDTAINPPLDWTQGVVQFGHHGWGLEEPNTYHWDNFHIEPAVPFSIIGATSRSVNADADTFTFPQPALTDSYLRFVGIGENLEVSFDEGVNWQSAEQQTHDPAEYKAEQFRTYWTAVPANTQTVQVRADDWWAGEWFVHSAAFWSLDGTVAPPATPTPIVTTETPTPQQPIEIEVSNHSGVSGYEIGVFGEGFGTSGTLTILGAPATVVEWENDFIRAIVPEVADGSGEIQVETTSRSVATAPFTVYSINPAFLQPPAKTFEEVSFDKTLALGGLEFAYCYDIETGAEVAAGRFLTNYRCGSGGFVGSGEATFAADSALNTTATIAYQSDTVLDGEYAFQFVTDFFWEPYLDGQTWRKSHPYNYTLEVSTDSTDGTDGTWTTLETISGNDRPMRYHTLDIPAAGGYTWLRMHVTDGSHDGSGAAGRDFNLRQVRVYAADGTGSPDSVAVYGDALTYSAFEIFGPHGFSSGVESGRLANGALPLSVYGLPGARADRLADGTTYGSDLFDALTIDNMSDNALYWTIALGTNDVINAAGLATDPAVFLTEFGDQLDAAVQELVGRGRVPVIARIPDTFAANRNLDTTVYKLKALEAIDTVAATHGLIPGADLYTIFRRNIEADGASYLNGGTQLNYAGREAVIASWINTFVAPFPKAVVPTPTPTPNSTVTPVPTSTPAPGTPTPTPTTPPSDPSVNIEVANSVGVIGAEVGIFGDGFGETAGSVTILDVPAQIVSWSDSFVKVIVPAVADGVGHLHLQSADNRNGYTPFTVYTIDPSFLQAPDVTFENIAFGQHVHTQNVESHFCFQQPENAADSVYSADPSEFLANYRCGSSGLTRTGSAQFMADSALGEVAIIAVDLQQELLGDYFFSYFVNGNWYPRPNSGSYPESNPRNYEMQVSADSTDGVDGTWQTLLTITDNDRSQRTHKLTVPAGGYNWLRMRVTDGNADASPTPGNDFGLREIRLFAPTGSGNRPDSFVIYGDSLTASNFETIGSTGFAADVKALRGVEQDMMLTTFGLSGQNSSGLVNHAGIDYDIYDALALDDMQTNAYFWGIGLGTNDANDPEDAIGVNGFNVEEYGSRLDAAVADLIASGRVPIVARIPDTDESLGGYGTLVTKRKILADIDAVVAKYRLVPGPDFYTAFRYNIEEENSTYFGADGTHHSDAGTITMIDMWAEAFTSAVPAVPSTDPTPTPIPTNTPAPTNTPEPTTTPLPTATPGPQSSVSVADYTVETSEEITVSVLLNPEANAIGAATINLTFDEQLLAVESCEADPDNQFDSAFCNPSYATNGIGLTLISNAGVTTAGSVGEVVFTATGDVGNASDLLLSVMTSVAPDGSTVVLETNDGQVLINGSVAGDVSCDVQRNIVDALFISQHVVGLRSATTQCPLGDGQLNVSYCDVDDNSTCDVLDAMYIAQCEVGFSNALCIQRLRENQQRGTRSATLSLNQLNQGEVEIVAVLSDDTPIGALTLDIAYDPTQITPVGCSAGNNIVGACNITFGEGVVRLTGASFTPRAGVVSFGNLYFTATDGVSSAEITASPVQLFSSNGELIAHADVVQTLEFAVPTAVGLGSAETSTPINPIWLALSAIMLLVTWVLVRRVVKSD